MSSIKRWLPLESNPDVLTKFCHGLGVPKGFKWTDVWGLDPELLMMVPRPVYAVVMLFPISEKSEEARKEEAEKIATNGQDLPNDVFYVKQYIGNACGTIALIHAICNNINTLSITSGALHTFFTENKASTAEERGYNLEEDRTIEESHGESSLEGQTEAPELDAKVDTHFIAFVQRDNTLIELDGRKDTAIAHGKSSPETLMEDAAAVARQFMARDPDSVNFTLMALVKDEE